MRGVAEPLDALAHRQLAALALAPLGLLAAARGGAREPLAQLGDERLVGRDVGGELAGSSGARRSSSTPRHAAASTRAEQRRRARPGRRPRRAARRARRRRRRDLELHLHRLDHQQHVAARDLVALGARGPRRPRPASARAGRARSPAMLGARARRARRRCQLPPPWPTHQRRRRDATQRLRHPVEVDAAAASRRRAARHAPRRRRAAPPRSAQLAARSTQAPRRAKPRRDQASLVSARRLRGASAATSAGSGAHARPARPAPGTASAARPAPVSSSPGAHALVLEQRAQEARRCVRTPSIVGRAQRRQQPRRACSRVAPCAITLAIIGS